MKALNLIFFFTNFALASGGEHVAEHGIAIPTSTIIFQALNLGILVFAGVYFLRGKVALFFNQRNAQFVENARKAQLARDSAEKSFEDIKNQIHQLTMTHEKSVQSAHSHASEVKRQIEQEAKDVVKRIREDAELTVKLEIARAKSELREQLMKDAFSHAENKMKTDVSSDDHQNLQANFSKHLEGLRP